MSRTPWYLIFWKQRALQHATGSYMSDGCFAEKRTFFQVCRVELYFDHNIPSSMRIDLNVSSADLLFDYRLYVQLSTRAM